MERNTLLYHVMFDIDGTLIQSCKIDAVCFTGAIEEVLGIVIDEEWSNYKHITDEGILNEIIQSNGLDDKRDEIREKVKNTFVRKIEEHLEEAPAQEVPGASRFIAQLNAMNNVVISIATGGWYESAMLKLQSAGISVHDIPIVSSDDHFSRAEIMKRAEAEVNISTAVSNTYFGDGAWDKKACEELGYNFVLVGNKVKHDQKIENFNSTNEALAYIGL